MSPSHPFRCIALDDEPWALTQTASYIEKTPFLTLVDRFTNPVQALEFIQSQPVDVLFLDIEMPLLNGLDLARCLVHKPIILIFTTSYREYAYEGFTLEALGYLLKPFSYEDFLKVTLRLSRVPGLNTDTEASLSYLFVKVGSDWKKLKLDEIVLIEALGDFVKIFTTHRKQPLIVTSRIHRLMEKLPPSQFMRVHRSYVVALDKVQGVVQERIVLEPNHYIPVGETFKPAFDEFLRRTCLR
ncbi:LytR/AlgR family response regulator transcription factor [Spirosoma soli]|uniref:LytR/AlgR family response regulator transcription factor n=1 Tax=Spirosoma soli TaxID=1770529 RepID=A0ABW5LWW0_9BACT